jgi:hypothetical protein
MRRYRPYRQRSESSSPVSCFPEARVIYPLCSSDADQSFPQYQEAVHDYTLRQLTYKTDICDAFAGIVHTFCKGDSPYHGIPLSIFEHALCWSESADAERLRPGSSNLPRALAVYQEPASVAEVRARIGRFIAE